MTAKMKQVQMRSVQMKNTQTPKPATIMAAGYTKEELFPDIVSSLHIPYCEECVQWGFPILLVLGLIGNVLCLVAFTDPHLRPKTRALCCLLCTLDSLALIVNFVSRWPAVAFAYSVLDAHPALCHVLAYSNSWLPELAAWTLVGVSIERLLALHFPRNSSTLLLRSRCCFVGVCALLVLMLISSVPLIELSLGTSTTQGSKLAFGGDGGPDPPTNSTARLSLPLDASDSDFELALDVGVGAESSAPFSLAQDVGSLNDYSNERQMQMLQQTLVQTMPTEEFGTDARLPSQSYARGSRARGGGEQIISHPAFSVHANSSRVGVRATTGDVLPDGLPLDIQTCELDASGAAGKETYWKFVDLVVYSFGPFLVTFLVNIAIIVRISRVRLQQNKSAEPPRVRFHTMPSVRMGCTEREPVADGERAVAVVELPQRNVICSEEIRGELQSARPSQHLIRNEAIPSNTSASRNQAITEMMQQLHKRASTQTRERACSSAAPLPCRRNTHAERRVSLMLFVTALTFLVLTAPASVGQLVSTLLHEDTVERMINQSAFNTLFAVSELLAFAQHASQFYVCFACSFCFRQALRRQLVRLAVRIDRLLPSYTSVAPYSLRGLAGRSELAGRSNAPSALFSQRHIQQEQLQLQSSDRNLINADLEENINFSNFHTRHHTCTKPIAAKRTNHERQPKHRANPTPKGTAPCAKHEFLWAGPSLLVCRHCRTLRLVHHPTCANFKDERKLSCSCLTRMSKPLAAAQTERPGRT